MLSPIASTTPFSFSVPVSFTTGTGDHGWWFEEFGSAATSLDRAFRDATDELARLVERLVGRARLDAACEELRRLIREMAEARLRAGEPAPRVATVWPRQPAVPHRPAAPAWTASLRAFSAQRHT